MKKDEEKVCHASRTFFTRNMFIYNVYVDYVVVSAQFLFDLFKY